MRIFGLEQYISAVSDPFGVTRTLGEFEVERDAYGNAAFTAGNNAVVFSITTDECRRMLKCYIKPPQGLRHVYDHAPLTTDPLLSPMTYLPCEVHVNDLFGEGQWRDVVTGPWIEGNTLATEIKRAAKEDDTARLSFLAHSFDQFAMELLSREWAHGDLKPDNIIVGGNGRMQLIDYDAMFLPELAGRQACETGTPGFQHPLRDRHLYDKSIDDYPIALISVSLHALALDPSLYFRYNNSDRIIFDPADLLQRVSPAYGEVLSLLASNGDFAAYHLALKLRSPIPVLEGLKQAVELMVSSGLPPAYRSVFVEGLIGFSDENGHLVIPPVFENASEFREGLSLVWIHENRFFIDTTGKIAIRCDGFDQVRPFSGGVAAVKVKDSGWGYIDSKGNIIMAPVFLNAQTMREGHAVVETTDGYRYIDSSGKYVTGMGFDVAFGFRDGVARAEKDGTIYEITVDGEVRTIP